MGLVSLIVLFSANALAAYPQKAGSIQDLAGILPSRDKTALLESIAWFKRSTGAELIVLTLPSWKDLGTPNTTWESFSTNLFNRWGIGTKSRNDGVLFVTAIKERKLRIELGSGFKRCYDPVMKQILEQQVVPLFKEARYGAGMVLGSQKIIQSLPKVCPVAAVIKPKPVPTPSPSYTPNIQPQNIPSQPFSPWLPLGAGLTLLGAWAGFNSLRRPKRCPNCQTVLEKLSEQADDEYLSAAQQLEERLSSVQYDIWHCQTCNNHEIIRRQSWLSNFSTCPSCQHQTLSGTKTPIVPASQTQQGLTRLERHCSHCQHQDLQDIILPRLERHSDRPRFYPSNFTSDVTRHSSSNFSSNAANNRSDSNSGGGRSSGGGASSDF